MTGEHRERRRATFDQDADLYDRARPGYPPALFDDLTELRVARAVQPPPP